MGKSGDEQLHHHPLHSQNQQQRPPSEHIYFSIESDYNSALAPNAANHEFLSTQPLNSNSIHRPSAPPGTWRIPGTHKNGAQQPYMV